MKPWVGVTGDQVRVESVEGDELAEPVVIARLSLERARNLALVWNIDAIRSLRLDVDLEDA